MKVIKLLMDSNKIYQMSHKIEESISNNIVMRELDTFCKVLTKYEKAKSDSDKSYYHTILFTFSRQLYNTITRSYYIDSIIERLDCFERYNKQVFDNLLLLGDTKAIDELHIIKNSIEGYKYNSPMLAESEYGIGILSWLNTELENI